MKHYLTVFIVILSFHEQVFAQEKDTLVKTLTIPENSTNITKSVNRQQVIDTRYQLLLPNDLKDHLTLQLQGLNNGMISFLKFESRPLIDSGHVNSFSLRNNSEGFYFGSPWDIYQGNYGIRTYQVGNKLFLGTAGNTGINLYNYTPKQMIYNQTNHIGSLFVGYKFSNKFSISAGFTIRNYGDPYNPNP
jgi:hypothetical protein